MRITNSMMINNFMQNLNNNLNRMEDYHTQLTTGKKFSRPSQNPVGMTRSLQARTDLSKVEKYSQNIDDAKAWLQETETALMELNSIALRASELALDGANGTKTADDRAQIAKEIEQLKEQLVTAGNTSFAGRYIFGGYNTTGEPFKAYDSNGDGIMDSLKYNGEDLIGLADAANSDKLNEFQSAKIKYEIGYGIKMDISIPGCDLLGGGENNLYGVLNKLSNSLKTSDEDEIQDCIGLLKGQHQEVLSQVAEVGAKTNRLDLMAKRLDNDEFNYKKLKSDIEDVDQEKVTMEFKMAEAIYRASLAVGSRIIQPSLVDFLR